MTSDGLNFLTKHFTFFRKTAKGCEDSVTNLYDNNVIHIQVEEDRYRQHSPGINGHCVSINVKTQGQVYIMVVFGFPFLTFSGIIYRLTHVKIQGNLGFSVQSLMEMCVSNCITFPGVTSLISNHISVS